MPKRSLSVDHFWENVDKSGECWEWTASKNVGGYGKVVISYSPRHMTGAHRVSWEMKNGPIPKGMFIDHICRNVACVRPDHLRLATPKQNLEHLAEIRANNTSGYRGVCWNKKQGFWQATVVHNYQRHFLGFFDTAEDAGAAAHAKRLELYTHNALDRADGPIAYTPPPKCGAPTKRGRPCGFRPHRGNDRCWQHVSADSAKGDTSTVTTSMDSRPGGN